MFESSPRDEPPVTDVAPQAQKALPPLPPVTPRSAPEVDPPVPPTVLPLANPPFAVTPINEDAPPVAPELPPAPTTTVIAAPGVRPVTHFVAVPPPPPPPTQPKVGPPPPPPIRTALTDVTPLGTVNVPDEVKICAEIPVLELPPPLVVVAIACHAPPLFLSSIVP